MTERTCRICGCTDAFGCLVIDVPCHWAEHNLCSVCAGLGSTDRARRAHLAEYLDERFRRFRLAEWNIICVFCGYTVAGEDQEHTDHTASCEEFHTITVDGRVLPVCRDCRDVGMPLFMRLGRSPAPWSAR